MKQESNSLPAGAAAPPARRPGAGTQGADGLPGMSSAPNASGACAAPNAADAYAVSNASSACAAPSAAGASGTPADTSASAPADTSAAPFGFTALDRVFAAVFLWVGWLYWEVHLWNRGAWELGGESQWMGLAVFTLIYAAAVLVYLFLAGRWPPRESWFWLAVLLCLGWSYALPYGGLLLGFAQYAALLLAAVYWTLCASGRLLGKGRTSNWLAFDLLNAVLVLPWGNFLRLPAALFSGLRERAAHRRAARAQGRRNGRRTAAVLGGIAAAALCLCFVLPELMAADDAFAGLFLGVLRSLGLFSAHWNDGVAEFLVKSIFAVPTACFLYGLAYGSVRGRRAGLVEKREVCAVQRGVRIAPRATVLTALGCLCAVYLLFASLQARYWFGAFLGLLPEGFSYAEYARQGFFELCRVAAANAVILIFANAASRVQAGQDRLLRLFNTALSVLTLLLLATAAGKMALYISVYGLTVKRVLASAFLLWLAIVFACVLLRQFRFVPLVRAAVLTGAVLFCLLCALPVGSAVERYNETGTQAGADAEITAQLCEGYAALAWDGRVYVPYCPVGRPACGRRVGCVDGDPQEAVYAYEGHSEREWLVAFTHSGLMDSGMLMREASVRDIPEGLESEYEWNQNL